MDPYRTAEVRWFRPGEVPAAVRAWFDALGPEVEPESRTDRYLAPTSAALGVKVREGQLEAKRRDGTGAALTAGRSEAPVEAWAKWSFALAVPDALAKDADLLGDGWIGVEKTRWQRHAGACALELSRLRLDGGEPWWSVCLEATGPDPDARRAALAGAARQWLGADGAPALPASEAQGYPAWLLARQADGGAPGSSAS